MFNSYKKLSKGIKIKSHKCLKLSKNKENKTKHSKLNSNN